MAGSSPEVTFRQAAEAEGGSPVSAGARVAHVRLATDSGSPCAAGVGAIRTFDPWEGSRYREDGIFGIRLLILGEAHYDTPERETRQYTIDVVRRLGQGQQRRFRFFTMTQKLVSGVQGWVSDQERVEFWERVAFCNYIQTFPGQTARRRPTPEMWTAAREPFLQSLRELSPQLVLVLGVALGRHLPDLPAGLAVCRVEHPSSGRFRYDVWQPVVHAAIQAAVAANGGPPRIECPREVTQ